MFFWGAPNIEKLKRKGNIKALGRALSYEKDYEKDYSVIKEAALALHELGRMDVIEKRIPDDDLYSTSGLQDALIEIGSPAAKCFIALIKKAYNYTEELAHLGPLDFDPLTVYLGVEIEDGEIPLNSIDFDQFSEDATEGLGLLGDPRAIPILSRLYDYDGENLKYRSADALKKIGNSEAIEVLISKLSMGFDYSWPARSALTEIGRKAVPALKKVLKDKNRYSFKIREEANLVLKRINEEEGGVSSTIKASFAFNPNSVGCPYLRQNACHFRKLSSKNDSGGPERCSLEVNGYQNCHVWAIEPR